LSVNREKNPASKVAGYNNQKLPIRPTCWFPAVKNYLRTFRPRSWLTLRPGSWSFWTFFANRPSST